MITKISSKKYLSTKFTYFTEKSELESNSVKLNSYYESVCNLKSFRRIHIIIIVYG